MENVIVATEVKSKRISKETLEERSKAYDFFCKGDLQAANKKYDSLIEKFESRAEVDQFLSTQPLVYAEAIRVKMVLAPSYILDAEYSILNKGALDLADKLIKLSPRNSYEAHFYKVQATYNLGRFANASELLLKLSLKIPESIDWNQRKKLTLKIAHLHYELADHFSQKGDVSLAKQHCRRGLEFIKEYKKLEAKDQHASSEIEKSLKELNTKLNATPSTGIAPLAAGGKSINAEKLTGNDKPVDLSLESSKNYSTDWKKVASRSWWSRKNETPAEKDSKIKAADPSGTLSKDAQPASKEIRFVNDSIQSLYYIYKANVDPINHTKDKSTDQIQNTAKEKLIEAIKDALEEGSIQSTGTDLDELNQLILYTDRSINIKEDVLEETPARQCLYEI